MSDSGDEIARRIKELELENIQLKSKIRDYEEDRNQQVFESKANSEVEDHLSLNEYERYGRQMIVKEFGSRDGQIELKKSSFLVIGAGGLGCPLLLYLVAAGAGRIGIVDNDVVDISNLHRQVLHNTDNVGMFKCDSAKMYLSKLNPHVTIESYPIRLSNENAFSLIEEYDIILDCTDTPATRYLINDVSVISGKTIISGSGLRSDGQLTILNFNNKGPCYRCFYPSPPSPESVTKCSDGGVIGPAIGLIGVLMALEAIKVATKYYTDETFSPFLSSYSGYPQQQLRVFKMRSRKKDCLVCGASSAISKKAILSREIDYAAFCGSYNTNVLDDQFRISAKDFYSLDKSRSTLIDVRPDTQFAITKLNGFVNIPWDSTFKKLDTLQVDLPGVKKDDPIYVVCRYGNDSQLAAKKLLAEMGYSNVKDIKGGLNKWSEEVDPKFPKY
ncbi:uncharacterized protein PRCAT00000707001 [Priceomyces carsonii]|uniref:uncharacterized protein n=1 Tax=Priceomyces carsonii TaxID=28549 RepID=UPI002ED933C8|nr:unnamed protein product [Priceomyces carsonii]